MDTVVPLGLIVNELVSNSLKHAFVDRDNGQIQIELCKGESIGCKDNIAGSKQEEFHGTSFILIVSDNGVGIPGDFDLENPASLGMQLVNTLIDQLEGKLELKKGNGTEFTIKFRVM
ncbi:MAG TPA: sensor histidine kinase [Methanosarcina vacuolata]|nr:sensor histidine kinase [Methanosarcina vacuolata]